MKIPIRKFSSGLYLASPKDAMPEGTLRRSQGTHALSDGSARSRPGSSELVDDNAYSIIKFNDVWYHNDSTILFRDNVSIQTGLDDSARLSFLKMPPTAGVVDQLFLAGGGALYKDDGEGLTTNWGIAPPANNISAADSGNAGNPNGTYKYGVTFLNSLTGTRSNGTSLGDGALLLLLDCNGDDAHTTFTDTSPNAFTITANGNAQGDTAQKKFGTAAALFDGTGDYLSMTQADFANIARNLGSTPFQIDMWVYLNTSYHIPGGAQADRGLMSQWEDADNRMKFTIDKGIGYALVTFSIVYGGEQIAWHSARMDPDFITGKWYHIALIRGWGGDPNAWAITVDGTKLPFAFGRESDSFTWPQLNSELRIGQESVGPGFDSYMDGWIDEISIYATARQTANFTAPTAAYPSSSEVTVVTNSIDLTQIPISEDSQVDTVEIWRTFGDGSLYFRAITLSNGTTTYTDDIADIDLEATELPLDNLKPFAWFDDVAYHNASAFWITRSEEGKRGRIYYSPIGRSEAVQGFIEITNDDDGCQKLFIWQGNLGVITKSGAYQIIGQNPYQSRELSGTPGTAAPHTVATTPSGIYYEASDGVRRIVGTTSQLIGKNEVSRIFRGEDVANLTSFTGVVAAFARDEYIISDITQTLAVDINSNRWREIGIGCNALYYDETNNIIAAAVDSAVVDLEDEDASDDNGTEIPIEIESQYIRLNDEKFIDLQHIHLDVNCNGESITITLICDNVEITLGTLQGAARETTTLNIFRMCQVVGVRFTGNISTPIEIFGIEFEVPDGQS